MNARLCRRLNHDRGKFSISQNPLSRWQNAYQAALWELDPKKLLERVTAAETAIFNRIQALLQDPDHAAELQTIEEALASLRVLRRDNLGPPVGQR